MSTLKVYEHFDGRVNAVLSSEDCRNFLKQIPEKTARLVITSPPYNIGKPYEKKLSLDEYVKQQEEVIGECVRILANDGSICWQVGNYVRNNSIIPLDTLLYPIFERFGLVLRNRIIWHFEHGLHCSKRLSGRYETVNWFTRKGNYFFNLDPIRVPQKYPNKRYFKGPKTGQLSSNPLGKNPGDVWIIPNVKHNHVEKTVHPCQFPVELIERFILSLTEPNDWVIDPFIGVGSTAVAALKQDRRVAGCDIIPEYISIAKKRATEAMMGIARTRPMNRPIYSPVSSKPVGGEQKSGSARPATRVPKSQFHLFHTGRSDR